MTNNTPDYNDNLYFEEKKITDTVTIEKQVWESTLHRSMVLEADNKRLKHDVGNLGYKIKNQRHEIDNRLKEIAKLKELLKECEHMIIAYSINNNTYTKDEVKKTITKIAEVLNKNWVLNLRS